MGNPFQQCQNVFSQQFQNAVPQGLQYQQALGMLQAPADVWDEYLLANMSEEEFVLMRRGGSIFRRPVAREANGTANALLYRLLTREQKLDLERYGWFDVEGRGKLKGRLGFRTMQTRRFRIYLHGPSVQEVKPNGTYQHFCVMCTEAVPRCDVMLAMKLLIEADVVKFLKTANRIGGPR